MGAACGLVIASRGSWGLVGTWDWLAGVRRLWLADAREFNKILTGTADWYPPVVAPWRGIFSVLLAAQFSSDLQFLGIASVGLVYRL